MSRDIVNLQGLRTTLFGSAVGLIGVSLVGYLVAKTVFADLSVSFVLGSVGLTCFSISSLVSLGGYAGVLGDNGRHQDMAFFYGALGGVVCIPVLCIAGLCYFFGL